MIPQGSVKIGLLFIPDISGFTRLVHRFDVLTGKQITCELLSTVLHQNQLNLTLSEVEGDAILFYRYGAPPSLGELIQQYNTMTRTFEVKRLELEESLSQPLDLSLKIIAHYGPMAEYKIGPFTKLFGEVVVEAHRLLKNSIESNSYLLLTDALVEAAGAADKEIAYNTPITSNKRCELDSASKDLCFTYLDIAAENERQVA